MLAQIANPLGSIFATVFFIGYIVVLIFVLSLLWRFTNAHERMAEALEKIARKMKDDDRQA